MDIKATKLELMQLLLEEQQESVLAKVKDIFTKKAADWWDDLTEEQKNRIKEGKAQLDAGQGIPHEELKLLS